MKTLFALALLLSATSASAQTTLQLGASWDDKVYIVGTAMLVHCVSAPGTTSGPCGRDMAAVEDWNGTFKGWATLNSFIIQPDTLYTVTLVTVNPNTKAPVSLSFTFLVPSLIMSPGRIHSATYSTIVSRTTNQPVIGETQISVKF